MRPLTPAPGPQPRPRRTVRFSSRGGMTLIECMVALTIITSSLLGFGAFLTKFQHTSNQSTTSSLLSDLATSRVEAVKAYPTYSALEATFNMTESSIAGCTGCVRVTLVTRTSTATSDYKTVTVTVTAPSITAAEVKTTAIAAF
jgi:prepilin-type N-terminal cleavage/methylation domain-containing protein